MKSGILFCYEARIRFSENTHSFGVRLYEDDYDGDAYRFHIAVSENRMLFDKTLIKTGIGVRI